MANKQQAVSISEMFGVQQSPSKVQLCWAYIYNLAENYKGHEDSGLIYDAIVKAQDMLYGDNPEPADIFVDAINHNADIIYRQSMCISGECIAEQKRLNSLKDEANKLLISLRVIRSNESVDFSDYFGNKFFLIDSPSELIEKNSKEKLLNLLDEIEVSSHVSKTMHKNEVAFTRQVDAFDDWMKTPEFKRFIQTYDFLQYTMRRAQECKSTVRKTKLNG